MKRAVRIMFLMVGLACAYVAVATPMVAVRDGGPMPLCRPTTGCPQ
jgi:hypothetical protein